MTTSAGFRIVSNSKRGDIIPPQPYVCGEEEHFPSVYCDGAWLILRLVLTIVHLNAIQEIYNFFFKLKNLQRVFECNNYSRELVSALVYRSI